MGISSVGHVPSFPELNQQVSRTGQQKAAEGFARASSYYESSNFGNDTKVGTGFISRESKTIVSIGEQKTSEIMDKAKAIYSVSNFGNQTKIGTSKFQQGNKQTTAIGEHQTSKIMDKTRSYYEVSNFGNETKIGTSRFQQQIRADYNQGMQNMGKGMKSARENGTTGSNFGNATKLGSSAFQKVNAQIKQHSAQAAYAAQKKAAGSSMEVAA